MQWQNNGEGRRMIISERQIMHLIQLVNSYREVLLNLKSSEMLPSDYEQHWEASGSILNEISNQQSKELKDIQE